MRPEVVQPIAEERRTNMFDGINAKAINARGVYKPATPVLQLPFHKLVAGIQIVRKQEIIVAVFMADFRLEGLILEAVELVIPFCRRIVSECIKAPPKPLHTGIGSSATRKCELGVARDWIPITQRSVTIIPVYFLGPEL